MAAQEAGIAAIEDCEFIENSKNYNQQQLKFVKNSLTKLGIKFYESFANFILIDFKNEENCQKINQYLLDNGVIIRDMKSYNIPNCLRMTIGTEYENKKFIDLLTIS
jgi:histidinol-phosphate aminotransferase